jgi:hypothetical protein
MKALRIGVMLATVASAVVACLWLLDVVSGERAVEALTRVLAVVGVLTVAGWVIAAVAGRGPRAS